MSLKKRRVVKRMDLNVKTPTTAVISQTILVIFHAVVLVSVVQFSLGSTDWTYAKSTLPMSDSENVLQLKFVMVGSCRAQMGV